ncbi:MAG: hypothetical protein U0V70_18495 [Terriglobia bacterium]
MRRRWSIGRRFLELAVVCFTMIGCINSETVIQVSPDGSGQVIERTLLSKVFVDQLTAMFQGFAGPSDSKNSDRKGTKAPDLFTEESARKRVTRFGEGVSFVSSKKISTADWEGLESVFAFKDIRTIRLSGTPESLTGMDPENVTSARSTPSTFGFEKLANGDVLLTVMTSPVEKKESATRTESSTPESKPSPTESSTETEGLKKMLAGFRVLNAIEIQGTVVRTTIPYQAGNRLTLLELDFGQLLGNAEKLQELKLLKPKTLDEAKSLLADVPGIKIPLESKMTVEFRGR